MMPFRNYSGLYVCDFEHLLEIDGFCETVLATACDGILPATNRRLFVQG